MPIALERHGDFTRMMFGIEKDKMLTVKIGETAME
jgi:hypothetical protein